MDPLWDNTFMTEIQKYRVKDAGCNVYQFTM